MENYKLQQTTVWRFENRGEWATHKGDYRGNWSPHIPRNIIMKYSKEKEVVLDMFLGGGTTLVEAKLLGRRGIGVDINEQSIEISKKRINFKTNFDVKQMIVKGNATNLSFIADDSVDLICTHPPYANIIKYSNGITGDLSLLEVNEFLSKFNDVVSEAKRVIKRNGIIAIMIGDCRKNKKVVTLGFMVMNCFINKGLAIQEIIIKEQFNCASTKYWENRSDKLGFYLLAHEYIFIFKKE